MLAGLLVGPASVASGQSGGLGIRLLEAPVSGREDPRAHVYIVDHVEPGATFSRSFEVSNTSDRTLHPDLYVAGAEIDDGTFLVGSRETENELTEWATVEPTAVELAPGERAEPRVTIAVPDDAADGEYYGAIFAEEAPRPGAGVQVASRVGIRVYLSVGEGDAPKSDFEISTLTTSRGEDGEPVVEASVTNTGGRALDMSGSLEMEHGPAGLSAGPFAAVLGTTLAIGATEPVTVVLDAELPAGPWDATLTLASGRLEKSVTATITFPDAGEDPRTFEATPEQDKAIAGTIALIVLVVVGLGLLASVRYARRAKRAKRREADRAPSMS